VGGVQAVLIIIGTMFVGVIARKLL
jgi:hypothetical protein